MAYAVTKAAGLHLMRCIGKPASFRQRRPSTDIVF